MQLQPNHDGEQYMTGLPIKDKPRQFVGHIIEARLPDWIPSDEGSIASFSTAGEAQRAIEDLRGYLFCDENPAIYKEVINCLGRKEREQ